MFLSTLIWSPHSRWGTRELQHGQFLPVTRHPQIAREGDWNCKMCHLVTKWDLWGEVTDSCGFKKFLFSIYFPSRLGMISFWTSSPFKFSRACHVKAPKFGDPRWRFAVCPQCSLQATGMIHVSNWTDLWPEPSSGHF